MIHNEDLNFHNFILSSHESHDNVIDIFIKNGYSKRFIDKCVKIFLNKVFIPKWIIETAEKKQVTIVLSCTGMILTELKVKLHKTFKRVLPACDLRVVFRISTDEELFQLQRQN